MTASCRGQRFPSWKWYSRKSNPSAFASQRRAVFAWTTSTDASDVVEAPAGGATICLAATGDSLLTGGYDGAIGLWSLAGGKVSYRQAREGAHGGAPIPCLAITPDGRFVASAGLDGCVRLWRLQRGPDGG